MLSSVPLVRQVLLALVAVVVLTLGVPSPSWAHAALSSTTPADGAEVAEAPSEVVLQFTDEVIQLGAVLSVTGPAGSVDAGPLAVSGATVTAGLPASLPGGAYSVDWRVSSSDGHPISGTFSFSVVESTSSPAEAGGPPVAATTPASAETAPPTAAAAEETGVAAAAPADDGAGALVMWLFVGSAVVLGLLVGAFVFLRSRRGR